MKNILKYGAMSAALLVSSFPTSSSHAENMLETAPITVEAAIIPYPATKHHNLSDITASAPYSDSADYLRSQPGVTAGRFGGHGLEVFIRGQSQGQLNIVSDDAYTFGGCPNRMDPPTAYLNLQPQDQITVIHGYQSVLKGFGGSGGSVIIEPGKPDLDDDFSATGLLQGGYDSNSDMWNTGINVTAGTSQSYANAYGAYKDAGNYEDGDGNEIRSSFEERSGGLKLGYTPDDTHLYAAIDYHKIEDALFEGSSMDSPLSEAKTFKAGLERQLDSKIIQNIKVSGYSSLVDHEMDNFSLRPLTAMNAMVVNSESDTYGLKIKSDMILSERPFETVLEWRRNNRDAERYLSATNTLQSLLWPDITIDEIALAGETVYDTSPKTRLVVGGRYDYVYVDYGRADEAAPGAGNRTPNNIYSQFYGVNASSQTEHNWGGLLRLEYDYKADTMLYAGLSRSVRTADATERGLANYMGMGGASSWVGNPEIDPEKHHQIDAGFDRYKSEWSFGGSVYANIVEDYILRDSARSQPGVLVDFSDADIYRNIDAFLAGFELHGSWEIAPDWILEGDATYTYGEDLDAGHALPQMPPLQGKIGAVWQAMDHLELGTTVRWAMEQTRVDTDPLTGTGRDVDKTNGYAVLDFEGTLTEFDPVSLNFGVTNIFDTTYASHLNRSNISDPTEFQVNEPGRSFYIQISVPF